MNNYERIYNVLTEQGLPKRFKGVGAGKGLEKEKNPGGGITRERGWWGTPKGAYGVTSDETEDDVTRKRVAHRTQQRQGAIEAHGALGGAASASVLKARLRSIAQGADDPPSLNPDPTRRPQGVPVQRPKKF